MEDLTTRLSKLGQAVAEVSDRMADRTALPNARRRFLLSGAPAAPRPGALAALTGAGWGIASNGRVRAMALSFAAAALVVIAALVLWPRQRAISFAVGASASPGAVGEWVAPEGDAPIDLRFSEGTLVTLAAGARLRVTDTAPEGASLLIERGSIHAAITHRNADTRWSLRAGPFEVRVTGTSFDARWDPASETFELTMHEGSVIVSGPHLPSGRPVVAGEHLLASRSGMELRAGGEPPAAAAAPSGVPAAPPAACASPGPTPPEASNAPASSAAPADARSATPHANDASWKALAKAGKYREAMDAAEAAGFGSELSRASSSELILLADAARFSGRAARAKEALLAARKRGARGSTAFLLGKISADQLRSSGEASTWFELYLQEEPRGALAEQALGRLLEIRKRDPKAGRAVAERYLARYPNGAYAALARSLVPR